MIFSEIRKNNGFSQQYLADSLGISQATVAMWETGKSVPTMKTLLKLSELFNIDIKDLYHSFSKIQ